MGFLWATTRAPACCAVVGGCRAGTDRTTGDADENMQKRRPVTRGNRAMFMRAGIELQRECRGNAARNGEFGVGSLAS